MLSLDSCQGWMSGQRFDYKMAQERCNWTIDRFDSVFNLQGGMRWTVLLLLCLSAVPAVRVGNDESLRKLLHMTP